MDKTKFRRERVGERERGGEGEGGREGEREGGREAGREKERGREGGMEEEGERAHAAWDLLGVAKPEPELYWPSTTTKGCVCVCVCVCRNGELNTLNTLNTTWIKQSSG